MTKTEHASEPVDRYAHERRQRAIADGDCLECFGSGEMPNPLTFSGFGRCIACNGSGEATGRGTHRGGDDVSGDVLRFPTPTVAEYLSITGLCTHEDGVAPVWPHICFGCGMIQPERDAQAETLRSEGKAL